MKLYIYDHCPFCCRARMIFGLKKLPLEIQILRADDVDTPTRLVGKKTAPILEKEDGSHMVESMDIVHYIDACYGEPMVAEVENSAIRVWHEAAWRPILELATPRLANADFAEFATPEAREAFRVTAHAEHRQRDQLPACGESLHAAYGAKERRGIAPGSGGLIRRLRDR